LAFEAEVGRDPQDCIYLVSSTGSCVRGVLLDDASVGHDVNSPLLVYPFMTV
jgi:hypothetical protein